jgi:hypothetical protein
LNLQHHESTVVGRMSAAGEMIGFRQQTVSQLIRG